MKHDEWTCWALEVMPVTFLQLICTKGSKETCRGNDEWAEPLRVFQHCVNKGAENEITVIDQDQR